MPGRDQQDGVVPRRHLLGRSGRRTVLAVHVWAAGAWIGLDLALGTLVVTELTAGDPGLRASCLQVLRLLAGWPLVTAGLLSLATGLLLGLGTAIGLVRSWWVLVKLVLNLVLTTLVLVLLDPNTRRLAEQGRRLLAGESVHPDVSTMVMPPAVTIAALTFAVYLSYWRPWGRTPWARERRRGRPVS